MSDLQTLLDRNQNFAADYQSGLSIMPRFNTMVLTCADARIDPAHFMELDLGEALVFRNAGGRVTDELIHELGVLWLTAQKMAGENFRGFGLAIVQHTDCGFERLANSELAQMLSQRLGLEKSIIEGMSITDHNKHILADIQRLHQSPLIPNEMVVSGHLYDVQSGLIQEVVTPAPLATQLQLA